MKVLITGGAGFLGQQLVRALLDAGSIDLADAGGKVSARSISRVVCFDVVKGAIDDARVDNRSGDIG